MLKAPVVLSSRRRMLVQIAFASPAPSRSRSRTVTSSRLPVRVVPMYRRPREVDSRACSSVTGYPPRARASATSSPLGRVVGVPAMYRVMTPTAQPRANDRPTPARAIPPLSRVTTTREPITTMVRTFHGRRLMRRATVMNAMRPPRIGAVATLSGLVDPASAASSRGTPALDRAMEARVSTTTAMRSATNASNSWRRRRRSVRLTATAMGRPRVPMPPMMFRARTTNDGSSEAPEEMSSSRPAAVLVANQATRTVAALMARARTNRARSSGRRTRRGMSRSSMTTEASGSGPESNCSAPVVPVWESAVPCSGSGAGGPGRGASGVGSATSVGVGTSALTG